MIRAKCVDLSDQGVCITCEQPIEPRTTVYVQAQAYGLMGNATVRYCRRSGIKHSIGLMFSTPARQAELHAKREWHTSACQERGCTVRAAYLVMESDE